MNVYCVMVSVSDGCDVDHCRSLSKGSDLRLQATAVESSAHRQRSLATAAATRTGHLQQRRSRGGRICGRRSVEHAKTLGDVDREADANERKIAIDGRKGAPVAVVKRGRGRPRKVCIALTVSFLVSFL